MFFSAFYFYFFQKFFSNLVLIFFFPVFIIEHLKNTFSFPTVLNNTIIIFITFINAFYKDIKNDLIAEIDKWNSAYDSIKPLVSEEEERLQEFKALKEQAELERIDVLNAKNSDENILAISTNLSEINANIVNEQNMVDQQLEEQQASIKNTLALFGY